MTVNEIFELGLIDDNTAITICDNDLHLLVQGNCHQDDVLEKGTCEVESFEWQDDSKFFINLK